MLKVQPTIHVRLIKGLWIKINKNNDAKNIEKNCSVAQQTQSIKELNFFMQ